MHVHVVAGSFPPDTAAGAKSLFKLLYPLSRDPECELEVATISPRQLPARDDSLTPYLTRIRVHHLHWHGQRLFEIGNRFLKLHTDDYYLFARACRKLLLQQKAADLYLLRGQYFSTFLLAPFIRYQLQRPVVLFYSDPWLQNNFLRWTPALRQRCAHAEAEALRCASGVIFTNTATARAVLCNRTDRHLRHLVLPHVYLPELYASVSNDSKRRDVVFTYAGHFYGSRQPEKLFAALALMHREHPALAQRVRLQIVGPAAAFYKKQFDRYLQQLSGLGLATRVQLLGQRDYLSTLKILQASDVLINIDAEAEQSLYLPSKLIDYLGSEKPIWTISPPGPAYELVERYGGLATHATNVNEIMRDFARCVTRTLQQNWNLDCAFAGQFESWKVYPQLKSFLETLATEGQRTLSHRSIARGRSRAPVA